VNRSPWRVFNFYRGKAWKGNTDNRRSDSAVRQRTRPQVGWTVLVDAEHLVVRESADNLQIYIHDDLVEDGWILITLP
jgi:hypothetical protein